MTWKDLVGIRLCCCWCCWCGKSYFLISGSFRLKQICGEESLCKYRNPSWGVHFWLHNAFGHDQATGDSAWESDLRRNMQVWERGDTNFRKFDHSWTRVKEIFLLLSPKNKYSTFILFYHSAIGNLLSWCSWRGSISISQRDSFVSTKISYNLFF